MKPQVIIISVAVGLFIGACGKSEVPQAVTVKVDHQPACTRQAESWFKGAYGEGSKTLDDGRVVKASHQAHYNAKRKQCLLRLTADTAAKDKRAAIATVSVWAMGAKPSVIASLVHVRDKLTHCTVDGKKCQSMQEWDAAVAPLMKE